MSLLLDRPMEVDPKTMKVAIYARKSNVDESGRNKSVDEQVRSCSEVVEFLGYNSENVRIFAEEDGTKGQWWWEGSSGPVPYRRQLTELMKAIRNDEVNVVVTWRSDRLYRDTEVAIELRKRFREKGVTLIAGTRKLDLESADGEFNFVTEAAANRKYRQRISEDIQRAHAFQAQFGNLTRSPSCYGFRSAGRGTQEVVPVSDELDVVRKVFQWFVYGEENEGPLGMGAIARKLISQGVRVRVSSKGQKTKQPDAIHPQDIRRILTNCMFIARWRHAGKEFPMDRLLVSGLDGRRETVVPLDDYEAAQRKLEDTRIRGKKSLNSTYLVSGLLVCGYCGRPMTAVPLRRKDGTVRTTYTCRNKASRTMGKCPENECRGIQMEVIDNWVVHHLMPDLRAKIEETRQGGRDDEERTLAALEIQLAKVQQKETNDLAATVGVLDNVQFAALARRLRSEREQLARQVAEVRSRLNARDGAYPDLSEEAVKKMSVSVLKDALRKCVKFIATTEQGLVVCDTWDQFVGGPWIYVPNGRRAGGGMRRDIAPPSLEATLEGFIWLKKPELFLDGRRFSLHRSAMRRTDEELVPGIEAWRTKEGQEKT
jgi:site-specific DNA recombinase